METGTAYERFSSDNQHEESIIAQRRSIQDYADRNDIKIVCEYTDEAKTATTDRRPGFLQMIDDITSGRLKVDYVLVQELNRFSRDRYDFAVYKHKLKQHGVRLISVTQPIPEGPEGIILESVIEAMSEHYSANLSKVVIDRMAVHAEKAIHLGGIPPLGYNVDPQTRKYVVNEAEAEIVRSIFEMAAVNESYIRIIDRLNSLGHKTKKGNPFGINSISEILRNEKYSGVYVFNRAVGKNYSKKRNNHASKDQSDVLRIPGAVPEIIDPILWRKVHDMMNERKEVSPRSTAKEMYILTGKIFCGECGSAFTGNSKKGGRGGKTHYIFYNCAGKRRTRICKNKDIQKDVIENYVLDEIENVFNPERIDELADRLIEKYQQQTFDSEAESKQIKANIAIINQRMDNLFNSIETGSLDSAVAGPRLNELSKEKKMLEKRIDELNKKSVLPIKRELVLEYLKTNQHILAERTDMLACKALIDRYVQKVLIYKEEIKVIFRIPGSPDNQNGKTVGKQGSADVAINGGGGGSRTPVRKGSHKSFSGWRPQFKIRRPRVYGRTRLWLSRCA